MNTATGMPEIDPGIPANAVSVYGQENAYEDFPVLKAFQQYIDSEQTKARKRLALICVFFGILMFVVIAVFVMLLVNVSSRNQALNDRLIEYAMSDRTQRASSPVVVQPAPDNSAVLALTARLDEMQKKLTESQAAEKAAAEAAAKARREAEEALKPKGPTKEELEIERLKALLVAEREKQDKEKERERQLKERELQREAELEAYRRKHYPELYEAPKSKSARIRKPVAAEKDDEGRDDDLLKEVDQILKEGEAIRYFDEDEEDEPAKKPSAKKDDPPSPPPPPKKEYSIPVDIRGSSSRWSVPNE